MVKIRREKETTYAMVCSPFLEKLEPIFKEQGFAYTLLFGEDIPKEIPHEVDLDGRTMKDAICCIKSEMNPEDVHRLMLIAWRPSKYS